MAPQAGNEDRAFAVGERGCRRARCTVLAAMSVILGVIGAQGASGFPLRLSHQITTRLTQGLVLHQRVLVAGMPDGNDRLLIVDSTQAVCHRVEAGGLVPEWHLTFDPPGSIFDPGNGREALGDATGDCRPDILLVTGDPGAGYSLACYEPWAGGPRPLWRTGPFIRSCEPWRADDTGHLGVYAFGDADADGQPEVYATSFVAVPGCEPRRLLAISGPSGRLLWQFAVGPQINSVSFLTRRDGEHRIIIGTYTPNNGFSDGPCPDSVSCVISLSPQGQVDWCTRLGGRFSRSCVALGDVNGDDQEDVVVGMQFGPDDKGRNLPSFLRLDPVTGSIAERHEFPFGVRELRIADLERDGHLEILVLGQDQGVYCFSGDFRPRWAHPAWASRNFAGIADLDGDNKEEIVVVSPPLIKVLDARGHLLVTEPVDDDLDARLAKLDGRQAIVVHGATLVRLLTLEPPTIAQTTALIGAAVVALASLGAIGLVAFRRRAAQALARQRAREQLLNSMRAFRHGPGGSSLDKINILQQTLLNWEAHMRHAAEDDGGFASHTRQFADAIVPELKKLAAEAQAAGMPREHWTPLVSRAEDAARGLRQLGQPFFATNGENWPARALRDLDEISAGLNGIKRHLDRFYRAPLLPTISLALEARAASLDGVHVQVKPGDDIGPQSYALVSAVVLQKVLENLLDNGIRAMAESEKREIRFLLARDGSFYRIDVEDGGCGIPRERWESIFRGGDSTRSEDGGYGLLYARTQLPLFGAKIFVHDSKPGQGTTFRVLLRAPDQE